MQQGTSVTSARRKSGAHRRPRQRRRAAVVIASLAGSLLAPAAITLPSAQAMTATEASWANVVFNMINSERKAHGLKALARSGNLNSSGRTHNRWMQKYDKLAHQLPGESSLGQREINAGYHWTTCGENIAWNSDMSVNGVKQLQAMMYNEKAPYDDHRINILYRGFADVGVDVLIDSGHHKVWLTTDFGHR
jgi:uncharacterized protein YkwD